MLVPGRVRALARRKGFDGPRRDLRHLTGNSSNRWSWMRRARACPLSRPPGPGWPRPAKRLLCRACAIQVRLSDKQNKMKNASPELPGVAHRASGDRSSRMPRRAEGESSFTAQRARPGARSRGRHSAGLRRSTLRGPRAVTRLAGQGWVIETLRRQPVRRTVVRTSNLNLSRGEFEQ